MSGRISLRERSTRQSTTNRVFSGPGGCYLQNKAELSLGLPRCVRVFVRVCMCACMRACILCCVHVCMCVYMCACVCTCVHVLTKQVPHE